MDGGWGKEVMNTNMIHSKTKINKQGYRLLSISRLTNVYQDNTDIIYTYSIIDNNVGETL